MARAAGARAQDFRLDGVEIRPGLREVASPRGSMTVEGHSMDVLVLLAERAGELVSREELLESVWGEQFVTEEVLTHAIWDLRRALGDDPRDSRFIQTLPKRGYRLTAEVSFPGRRGTQAAQRWWLAAALIVLASGVVMWKLSLPSRPADVPLHAVPLTGLEGMETWPALSPSGDRVVFAWNGRGEGPFQLYVKLVGGGDMVRLTDAPADHYGPAWSPDGQQIAFLRVVKPGMLGQSEVLTISALGGAERRLGTILSSDDYDRGWSPGLAWSPDGRFLAVVDMAPEDRFAAYRISLATGEKTRLTPAPPRDFGFANHPAFSPDGKTLAFAADWSNIYLQPLPVGEPELLAEAGDRMIFDLDWTPDGSAIVFSSGSELEARNDLRRVSVEGGPPRRLPFGMAETLTISSRGSRLVYDQRSWFNKDLWRFPGPSAETSGPPTRLTAASRADWGTRFSPDGSRIAFASERSGANNIWLCAADGTDCMQLTRMDRAWGPRWSPDGASLLFKGWQEGRQELHVMDIQGRFTSRLATELEEIGGRVWSPDGRWIYLSGRSRRGEGVLQMWKVPVEGGHLVPVSTAGAYQLEVSPNGDFLYYSDRPSGDPECVISRVPTAGGPSVVVTRNRKIDCDAWTVWKDSLVHRVWEGKKLHLELIDLETNQVDRFYTVELEVDATGTRPAVSSDGRWIVMSLSPPQTSDLMLVENFG